jgi:hypothetical protein
MLAGENYLDMEDYIYDIYVFSFCFMVIYVKRHKPGKSYFLLIGYHNFHFLDVF